MENIIFGFILGICIGVFFYVYEYNISKHLEKHMYDPVHKSLNVFVYTGGVVIMLIASKTYFSSYLYSLAGLVFIAILDVSLRRSVLQ